MASKKSDSPYKYTAVGSGFNSYFFTTIIDVVYEVKFVPSSDYFNAYQDLGVEVFEMIISIADNPSGGRLPSDERVAPTIFAIFEGFFLAQRHVIVFICDSTDGRGKARHRKFGHWFIDKNVSTDIMAKFDRIIVDGDHRIYLSMIMSRLNQNMSRIVEIFMRMGEEEK